MENYNHIENEPIHPKHISWESKGMKKYDRDALINRCAWSLILGISGIAIFKNEIETVVNTIIETLTKILN